MDGQHCRHPRRAGVSPSSVLTITNALIFDGTSPELVQGSILMRDGVIAAVGEVPAEGKVLDASGNVVVPDSSMRTSTHTPSDSAAWTWKGAR